jgi:hypothetical protein
MNSIRTLLELTSLALVALAASAAGCNKTNDVDISEGDLPAGAECVAGPNDPCAGACFQGICRSHCGSNRECPAGLSCFGDGMDAVCAPAGSMEFDLLKDCTDGCKVDILPFGREGYFRLCEGEEAFDNDVSPGEATSASFDPRQACVRTVANAIAVKDDVLYGLDFNAERPTCDTDQQLPIGVLGDTLIAHDCTKNDAAELVSSACTGRLFDAGGKTYLLKDPWCTPSQYADGRTAYWLYEFSPEQVDLPCAEADAPTCDKPTFPPVGPAVSGFEGFWVRCDNANSDNLCLESSAENAASALGNCPDLSYEVFRGGGFREHPAIYVRSDGYGMRWEGYPDTYSDSCNYAFRESSDGRVAVAGRGHAPVGTLDVTYEGWQLVTTDGGETALWRSDEAVCGTATEGNFFKKVEVPADFDDRCELRLPDFTF